ncbi:MAG: PaaI family thioesterase [Gammaproteobacteria bacterium]|nr:PaaI family thioesterase [Gammaproteobacteria bacterium]
MAASKLRDEQQKSLDGLRARALEIPLPLARRTAFANGFNELAAMQHFGATLSLADDYLVHVTLPKVEEHHRGGLGTSAVNGAVIAGMFDCALGVAGVLQFPDKRTGTVELSIKLLRPVVGDVLDFYSVAIKSSNAIAFAESELFSGGRMCALATGMVAVASDKDWAAVP